MKQTKSKRVIKAWTVLWKAKSAREYGVNPNEILSVETLEKFKVRCRCHKKKGNKTGWHYGDSMAIFTTLVEAKGWVMNNEEWQIIPITITYSLPSHETN